MRIRRRSGWPSKITPNMSKISRSWWSAVGHSSVAGTAPGATSRAARSRKKTVSSTDSASASRSSWAMSSSPVASGTLALPTAGHVDVVHRVRVLAQQVGDDLLRAAAAVARAPALRGLAEDRGPRLEHLLPDAPDDRRHLDRDATGQEDRVGLARRRPRGLEAEARDVDARADVRHPLDRAAREAEGQREVRVADRPAPHLVERGRQHRLLDVLLELGALQVAS